MNGEFWISTQNYLLDSILYLSIYLSIESIEAKKYELYAKKHGN